MTKFTIIIFTLFFGVSVYGNSTVTRKESRVLPGGVAYLQIELRGTYRVDGLDELDGRGKVFAYKSAYVADLDTRIAEECNSLSKDGKSASYDITRVESMETGKNRNGRRLRGFAEAICKF